MTNKNEKDLRYLLELWHDTGLMNKKDYDHFLKYYFHITAKKKGKAL